MRWPDEISREAVERALGFGYIGSYPSQRFAPMANHSLRASIAYRRLLLPAPTARALANRFLHSPPGSLKGVLAAAGPFVASHDAFAFTNSGWTITEDEALVLRERYQGAVDAVKLVGIEALRTALSGISVGVPIVGTVGLPALAIDEIIRRVTGALTDKLLDSIISGTPASFGRCGGMAFSGLDYFLAARDVPASPQQPQSGALRDYIWKRLLDSIDLNVVQFLEWTLQLHVMPVVSKLASGSIGAVAGSVIGGPVGAAFGALVAGSDDILGLGGPKVLANRTRQELRQLHQRLDAEPAWPIGLIFDDSALVWDQHQILALRSRDLAADRVELSVWDNNLGRMGTTWTVDATGDQVHVSGGVGRHDRVKGIIFERYDPAAPPMP